MITVVFWAMTLLCCGYAALQGRREGGCAAAIMFVGVVLTAFAENANRSWNATNFPVMAVDSMVCVGLVVLAFKSRSFWPMWMASAQLLAVLTHIASLFAASMNQRIYAGLASVWGLPCLACMVIGVALDHRARRLDAPGAEHL